MEKRFRTWRNPGRTGDKRFVSWQPKSDGQTQGKQDHGTSPGGWASTFIDKPNHKNPRTSPQYTCYRVILEAVTPTDSQTVRMIVYYYIPNYTGRGFKPFKPYLKPKIYLDYSRCYRIGPWQGRPPEADFRDDIVIWPEERIYVPAGSVASPVLPSIPYADGRDFTMGPGKLLTRKRRFLFGIHGAGFEHYNGAMHRITTFPDFADENNLIVVAPAFDRWYPRIPEDYVFPPRYLNPLPDQEAYRRAWVVPRSQEDAGMLGWYLDDTNQWAALRPATWPETLRELNADREIYNLHDFVWFLSKTTPKRTDLAFNEVLLPAFREHYPDAQGKFNLYGHSGGGQFVSRYMLTYPENLARVATSAAGSYLFPRFDKDFPLGLKVDNIRANGWGGESPPSGYVADLMRLTPDDWTKKILAVQRVPCCVFAGRRDTADEGPNSELRWQGFDHWQKAINFSREMGKARWLASSQRPSGDRGEHDYPLFLHIFPFDDHATSYDAACKWLKQYWLDYPWTTPYIYYLD